MKIRIPLFNKKIPLSLLFLVSFLSEGLCEVTTEALPTFPGITSYTAPVKVYILAGQSNTVGHGLISDETVSGTLDHTFVNDTSGKYDFLKDSNGDYVENDDVWIRFENDGTLIQGPLTPGYGNDTTKIGYEVSFGTQMQKYHGQDVLIIKTCWGGKSLAVDFRPPSSGGTTGEYYNEILRLVSEALTNIADYYPDYDASAGYTISGLCWHQGWNDHVNASYTAEYTSNLANLINDLRSDIGVDFPVAIATTGMPTKANALNGLNNYKAIEYAQLAIADTSVYPEFEGNIAVVDTKPYWYLIEDSPITSGGQHYHWNFNAKSYMEIGFGLADAFESLDDGTCPVNLELSASSAGVTLSWKNGISIASSIQILRNGIEIAGSLPGSTTSYTDTNVEPGIISYEVVFDIPDDSCDPLTATLDGAITNLELSVNNGIISLTWENNMFYSGIEILRNGVSVGAALSGLSESYTDILLHSPGPVVYTVMPSTGTTTPATAETIILANEVIYEPFDYPVGALADQSGSSEIGLNGVWSANASSNIVLESLTYGDLPVAGGSVGDLSASVNRYGGARDIETSALAERGLLADGATLWFSVLVGYGEGGNVNNGSLSLALANSSFSAGNYDHWITDEGADLGSGIGISLARSSVNYGRVRACQFRDLTQGDGIAGLVKGSNNGTAYTEGEYGFVVAKIEWGATSDTISIYEPGTSLELPSQIISTLTVDVDQAKFDTLTWSRGDIMIMDEIRFGASYDDVLGLTFENNDYATWSEDYSDTDLSNPDADSDNDGLSNEQEWIWGGNPTAPTSPNLPIYKSASSADTLSYSRRSISLTGADFTYEWSKTLTSTDWNIFTPNVVNVSRDGDQEDVTVTIDSLLLAEPSLFFRIVSKK